MALRGGAPDDPGAPLLPPEALLIEPLPPRSNKPPADWAEVEVTGGEVRLCLRGWRSLLGFRRRLAIPVEAITSVAHEPRVYAAVPVTMRPHPRAHAHVYRLGVYRGYRGWSFWACGTGRHAVLIETDDYRFRYVVVEQRDPAATIASIEDARAALRAAGRGPGNAVSAKGGGDEQDGRDGS